MGDLQWIGHIKRESRVEHRVVDRSAQHCQVEIEECRVVFTVRLRLRLHWWRQWIGMRGVRQNLNKSVDGLIQPIPKILTGARSGIMCVIGIAASHDKPIPSASRNKRWRTGRHD